MNKSEHRAELQLARLPDSILGYGKCFYQQPDQLPKVWITCLTLTACTKLTEKLCEYLSVLHVALNL